MTPFLVALLLDAQAVSPPTPPPPSGLKVVSQPDPRRFYPVRERKAGREGTAEVDLIVRNDGRVARCSVSVSSGVAPLDAAACKLARTLRFEATSWAGRSPKDAYGCCLRAEVRWTAGTGTVRTLRVPVPPMLRNARTIVTMTDYPPAALRTEQQGTVAVVSPSPPTARSRAAPLRSRVDFLSSTRPPASSRSHAARRSRAPTATATLPRVSRASGSPGSWRTDSRA